MARTGQVILANNIRVDKNYKNVLAYTESEMYSLVYANKTSELTNCSFIRDDNSMEVGLSYAVCQKANYLAFKNTSYSNKWFFAFIDKIEYVSNSVTRIYYTIDIWSTWYDYWEKKPCFVVRQHPNTDVAGDNTVPEGLEHGEYIQNTFFGDTTFQSYYFVVVANISLNDPTNTYPITKLPNIVINGATYLCNTSSDLKTCIQNIVTTSTPEAGAIYEVYIAPKVLFPSVTVSTITEITATSISAYYGTITIFNSKPTSLDNYYVVNKKLLTYPYCYLIADNKVGNTCIWKYENITSNDISVTYYGVPTVGCSIIASLNNDKEYPSGFANSLIGAKYPTLGWREDSYTNWLTQNAVNTKTTAWRAGASMIGGTVLLGGAAITGNMKMGAAGAALLYGGVSTAIEASNEYYQHQIVPDSIQGLISAGDALMSFAGIGFSYYGMCIKQEYAKKLDRFFNKYGYRQNDVQTPLFGSDSYRKYWNYIQIANDEVAAIPKYNSTTDVIINANDLQMINSIFRAGVTIWKLNSDIGDNNVWNIIVTPSNS